MDDTSIEGVPGSSTGQFEEFLESTVWADIVYELHVWLNAVRDGLESVDTDEKELWRNQGRAEACRYFMSLPEVMRDSMIEDQERRKLDVE